MFDGGIWIGAQTPNGIRVSTGAFNSARIGTAGSANFEFTNTADPNDLIIERSSLPDNRFFSPEAISHQDFVADFSDTNTIVPGTSTPIPNHTPLGIAVHLETYAWNFPFADAFVILNYTLTNVGYGGNKDTLKNVYVGLWADLVVRNTNELPPRVGAPFFQDVGVGYVDDPDTGRMIYAYEYDGSIYTGADSYIALVHLGATPQHDDTSYHGEVHHNWWLFSGGSDWQEAPTTEAAKYQRMLESIPDNIFQSQIFQQPGNYMNLISTGPFEHIAPDSSINVVFAIVCARKAGTNPPSVDDNIAKQNLFENVSWALRAYYGEDTNRNGVLDFLGTDSSEDVIPNGKLDRYILPTPPNTPILKAIPENGKVTLMWDNSAEESVDLISKQKDFEGYRLYRSFLGSDLTSQGIFDEMQLIGEFDRIDGLFYDAGLEQIRMDEPIVEVTTNPFTGLPDTVVYTYRVEIDGLHNGWQYAFSVSAFDSGDVSLNLPSLESSRLQNAVVVSPGTPPLRPGQERKIGVYPNPYRVNAIWDGGFERQRKLHFYNLPANCEVRIYTLAGDLVDQFTHNGATYHGGDIQWYQKFSEGKTIFPGGEHAWDLVSANDQAIATGLYLFTVKDLDTGDVYKGKFVIIK
ncbi:MAG: hypothetical protein D6748_04655 [Calditrichaeota bacterium]|nr:MAG: hypothetical protein D6748_04655 [Calditrichota bacterium]